MNGDYCCVCGGFVGNANFKFVGRKLYHNRYYNSSSGETFFNPPKVEDDRTSFTSGIEVAEIFGFENMEDWKEIEDPVSSKQLIRLTTAGQHAGAGISG